MEMVSDHSGCPGSWRLVSGHSGCPVSWTPGCPGPGGWSLTTPGARGPPCPTGRFGGGGIKTPSSSSLLPNLLPKLPTIAKPQKLGFLLPPPTKLSNTLGSGGDSPELHFHQTVFGSPQDFFTVDLLLLELWF